jgi:hypothetical protein
MPEEKRQAAEKRQIEGKCRARVERIHVDSDVHTGFTVESAWNFQAKMRLFGNVALFATARCG